jgi:hypothetical protein
MRRSSSSPDGRCVDGTGGDCVELRSKDITSPPMRSPTASQTPISPPVPQTNGTPVNPAASGTQNEVCVTLLLPYPPSALAQTRQLLPKPPLRAEGPQRVALSCWHASRRVQGASGESSEWLSGLEGRLISSYVVHILHPIHQSHALRQFSWLSIAAELVEGRTRRRISSLLWPVGLSGSCPTARFSSRAHWIAGSACKRNGKVGGLRAVHNEVVMLWPRVFHCRRNVFIQFEAASAHQISPKLDGVRGRTLCFRTKVQSHSLVAHRQSKCAP